MKAQTLITGLVALTAIVVTIACVDPSNPGGTDTGDDLTTAVDSRLVAMAGANKIALGDINGDGLIDVVSVASESQPVQIHLRNVDGSFDTHSIAGGAPLTRMSDVGLADINDDGKLDVIVLVSDTGFLPPDNATLEGALVILFQGSDATDANTWTQIPTPGDPPPANLSFPGNDSSATDMTIGDVNGDDYPDIVVLANEYDATRTYLFANPGPALATVAEVWEGEVIERDASNMAKAHMSDLDNDGDLDIIMSVPIAKSFNTRWLQNPLMESVSTAESYPTFIKEEVDPLFEATAGAQAVVLADLNNDGEPDVASISSESQAVQVHLRDPQTGHFTTTTIAGGGPLAQMVDLEMADLNEDGKLDLVVLVNDSGFAPAKMFGKCDPTAELAPVKEGSLVLLIQGNQTDDPDDWTQVEVFNTGTNDVGMTDSAVGDFNNDGLTDVVIISNEPTEKDCANTFVYTFTNPGIANVTNAGLWAATQRTIESDITDFMQVKVDDVERDGDDDVILTAPNSKTFNVRWMRNAANGTTWSREFIGQQEGGGDHMVLGDIDEDGNLDIAVASVIDGLVQWFRHPGPTALAAGAMQAPWNVFNIGTVGGEITVLQLADLDNDGSLDAFVAASGGATGFIRGDDIEQQWNNFTLFNAMEDTTVGRVAFLDFDGDGFLDFVAPLNRTGILDDEFAIYLSFSGSRWVRRLIGQQEGGADYIAVGDINNDGLDDVAAVHVGDGLIQWFNNPGTESLKLSAQQVPWDVYTIAQFSDTTTINGEEIGVPEFNQLQLADITADGQLNAFVTGSGTAFRLDAGTNVYQTWSASPVFTTEPPATIGDVGFLDDNADGVLDYVVPLDRDGLTDDSIIIFPGP